MGLVATLTLTILNTKPSTIHWFESISDHTSPLTGFLVSKSSRKLNWISVHSIDFSRKWALTLAFGYSSNYTSGSCIMALATSSSSGYALALGSSSLVPAAKVYSLILIPVQSVDLNSRLNIHYHLPLNLGHIHLDSSMKPSRILVSACS